MGRIVKWFLIGGVVAVFMLAGFVTAALYVPVEKIENMPVAGAFVSKIASLKDRADTIEAPPLPKLPDSTDEQVANLVERSTNVKDEVQHVLGLSSNGDEASSSNSTRSAFISAASPKPLHQRALDHSFYLYCKGIVEEYEKSEL